MGRAKAKENKEICEKAKFLRELLKEFGATLSGFDPGISAWVKNQRGNGYWNETLSFDNQEWTWLEPLLIELREFRALKNLHSGKKVVEKLKKTSRKSQRKHP